MAYPATLASTEKKITVVKGMLGCSSDYADCSGVSLLFFFASGDRNIRDLVVSSAQTAIQCGGQDVAHLTDMTDST